jgi:hypothetical protein
MSQLNLYNDSSHIDKLRPKKSTRPPKPSSVPSITDVDSVKEYFINSIGTNDEDNTNNTSIIKFQTEVDDVQSCSITNLLNLSNTIRLQNMFNPVASLIKNYVYVNSNNALTNNLTNISFNLNSCGPVFKNGYINTTNAISNIVAMRISKISFGIRSEAKNTILSRKRLTILIDELSAQSFVAPEGNRFHFITNRHSAYNTQFAYATTQSPYYFNRGWFKFNTPISKLDRLTLRFYCPFQPFALDADNVSATVTQQSNPAILTFTQPHGILDGPITISNFTTGNTVVDAAIINVFNSTFYKATSTYTNKFTVINANTISLNVNLSTTTALTVAPVVNVYTPINFTTTLEFITISGETL